MKKLIVVIIISLSVFSCATTKETYTSTGKKGYAIDCSGTLLTWNLCYEEAGEICKSRGYKTLDKQESRTSMYNAFYGIYQDVVTRTLVIECT